MTPVGVLVSGRGSNLAALIERTRLAACPFRIACVLSDMPGAPALELARAAGIPAFCHEKTAGLKKREFELGLVERLRAHEVQVVALAGYMRILGQTVLAAFPGRVLNIHPSLLPAFPGLHAQEQAHAAGVRFTGCTVHLVDAGMDTGPILDQACLRVPEGCTADELSLRILEHEHRLYPETLARFCRNEFRISGSEVAAFSPPASLRPVWEAFGASHFAGVDPLPMAGQTGHPPVAVSACLCGFPCRYDGADRGLGDLTGELRDFDLLAVCPEVLAGFGVPRPRIQYENEDPGTIADAPRVLDEHQRDVTAALLAAVDQTAAWCRQAGVRAAFLKENSPSCGSLRIPWRGRRIAGPGPLARRLEASEVRVFSEENFASGLEWLKNNCNSPPDRRVPAGKPGREKDGKSL